MFVLRIFVALLISFLTINQASAKLGPLEVLEVLRLQFDSIPNNGYKHTHEIEMHQQEIAENAVYLIVTSRLSPVNSRKNYANTRTYDLKDYFDSKDLHGTTSKGDCTHYLNSVRFNSQ